MKKFEVENYAESIIPAGEWELVWSDEFDGTELDMTKWDYRLSMMGKRHITCGTKGVKLDGNSNADIFPLHHTIHQAPLPMRQHCSLRQPALILKFLKLCIPMLNGEKM